MQIEAILNIVIEAVVLLGVGYGLSVHLKKVESKLEQVLAGQKHIEVTVAQTIKDVESNKDWGKDSKSKIEDLEKRVNTLEKDNEMVKATISKN